MAARRLRHQRFQGEEMRGGEIGDMDIVAHAGAVGRVEIVAEDADALPLAQRRFDRDLDEVGGAGGGLAGAPLRIGACDVEIA